MFSKHLNTRIFSVLASVTLVLTSVSGAEPVGDSVVVKSTPGLVGFWTFAEAAGQPRRSTGTDDELPLIEVGGPIDRVEGGPYSGYSADFDGKHYFRIPYADTGRLNIAGPDAQVSMFAVVRIMDLKQSRTIAGMWSEGKGRDDDTGTRQYAMLMNMPTYGGTNQLVPHISSEGGVTRRADGSAFPWCADYAASVSKVPEEEWCTLAFTYDGKYIRAYINGVMEPRKLDAIKDKRDDRYFTNEGPDGRDREMNPYYHGRGIFKYDPSKHSQTKPDGGADFTVGARYAVGSFTKEATIGRFGGLAVFNRALSDVEIERLHASANVEALNSIDRTSVPESESQPIDTDVCIYGATPAGIAAAVSAAKGGSTVRLVEPTETIGGLLTSGLSYTDFRSFESLTGFFFDFSQRVQADYEQRYGVDSEQAQAAFRGTHGEPSVNLRVLEAMLGEYSSIRVIKQLRLHSVQVSDFNGGRRRLLSATLTGASDKPDKVKAKIFIDATYEGDLMAMAGESYHVGRESREQYGESMAGNQRGEADGQVQGYNLRLIMTTIEENKRDTPKPHGYDCNDFVGVLPLFESGKLKKVFAADRSGIYRAHLPLMPNGKTDVNDTPHAPVRLSMPDINDAYPDGDETTRAEIIRKHYYYNIGLLYFLQNDEAVPPAIRADARQWALCKDEFVETSGLPPKLYIREARRMVGQHVFTESDTRQVDGDARAVLHTDSIAIGDYVHNCHGTGRSGSRFDGEHSGEFYKPVPPYQIPYGVIVPQKTENLLVPVACSASHFGFGALRLEPIWCSLGQASGWAAVESLKANFPVQSIDVQQLQRRLHADRSATIYVSDVPPTSPDFAAVQWWGARGGLHGLGSPDQPKPTSLGGQYNAAFPGHFVDAESILPDELRSRWEKLLPDDVEPPQQATRVDWINAVYGASGK